MCLPIFQRNLLPQYRNAGVAETNVSTCKTPQCRKADHHILNFHRFEKPVSHSYVLLFNTGIGYGQMFATVIVLLYYCALIALTAFYVVQSFAAELPWSRCMKGWEDCFDSRRTEDNSSNVGNRTLRSSSELFF
jgi:hypothetical protein